MNDLKKAIEDAREHGRISEKLLENVVKQSRQETLNEVEGKIDELQSLKKCTDKGMIYQDGKLIIGDIGILKEVKRILTKMKS